MSVVTAGVVLMVWAALLAIAGMMQVLLARMMPVLVWVLMAA
jgi:hypothetical protein